jgi:oligopeptide transport system substrate-binding protein
MDVILALALLLPQAAAERDTLRVSWAPPSQLDPHRAATLADARFASALFEGLVSHEADGVTPAPGMAERWEVSEDGRTWTFHLREARWSDGEPVTALDFAYAWRRALRPETGCEYVALFRAIRGVGALLDAEEADALLSQYDALPKSLQADAARRLAGLARRRHAEALRRRGLHDAAAAAVARADAGEAELGFAAADARTLRVTLERRTPHFLDLVAFMSFAPVPARVVEAHGESWARPGRIVTNGPYLLDSAMAMRAVLRRNAAYWDKAAAAAPERVVVEFRSPELALQLFREGRLDWITRDQIPPEKAAGQQDLVRFDTWGTYFLRLNCAKPPFDRAAVRAGFARAIDRARLGAALEATPVERLVPAGFRGYPEVRGLAYDRAGAMEALLKATGFDLSKLDRLELLTSDGLRWAAAGETLRELIEKALGVKVKLRTMKWTAYLKAVASGEYQAAFGGWMGDSFDPSTFLEGWTAGHPNNATGWSSAEYDALVRAAGEARDEAKRLATLAKAEALLLAEAPAVPLTAAGDGYLASPRVEGLRANLMSRFPLKHLRLKQP